MAVPSCSKVMPSMYTVCCWCHEQGYRNDHTSGFVEDKPESMYAVMGGNHYNDICCFDYGNAENHMGADGAGTMEAIYRNCTSWWVKSDRQNSAQLAWPWPFDG